MKAVPGNALQLKLRKDLDGLAESPTTDEDELERGFLTDLIHSFPASPSIARRAMQEMLHGNPKKFFSAALGILQSCTRPQQGHECLLGILHNSQLLVEVLLDPSAFTPEAAAKVARWASRSDPRFDVTLLAAAVRQGDRTRVQQCLKVLSVISDCSRLVPTLMRLVQCGEPDVRSQAAKLLVRSHRNADWLSIQLQDADPRYRANVIEGLMARKPSDREVDALWGCVADSNHRVASTALLVLFKLGFSDEAAGMLVEFLNHPFDSFKVASLWAMGQTGDRRFLAYVQSAVQAPSWHVRSMAKRALALLNQSAAAAKSTAVGGGRCL